MIRRKMWATATFCLAIAGVAQAQTGIAPKATLGKPQPDSPGYVARGASPNPGYPSFVPRNYTAPTPPKYASTAAQPALLPVPGDAASMSMDARPAATLGAVPAVGETMFAIDTVAPTAAAPVMTIPAAASPGTGTPVTGTPINGATMGCGTPTGCGTLGGCAPYLDSTCGSMPTCWFS